METSGQKKVSVIQLQKHCQAVAVSIPYFTYRMPSQETSNLSTYTLVKIRTAS